MAFLSTKIDAFGGALNTGLWTAFSGGGTGAATTSSGQLFINHDYTNDFAGWPPTYTGVKSTAGEFDSVFVRMYPPVSDEAWKINNFFAVLHPTNDEGVGFKYQNGTLSAHIFNDFGDEWTFDVGSVTYNATNHAFLRLRYASSVFYWDAAPDNGSGSPGTWTNLWSTATSNGTFDDLAGFLGTNGASIWLLGGHWDNSINAAGVTSPLKFDGVNGPLVAVTTITGALAVTEGNDTFASTGHPSGGAMNAMESVDTFAAPGAVKVAGALAVTEAGSDILTASNNPVALAFSSGADGFWFEALTASNFSLNGAPLDRASTYNGGSTVYDRNFDKLEDLSNNNRDLVNTDMTNDPGFYMFGGNGQPGEGKYWGTVSKGAISGPGGATTGFYLCAGITPDGYEGTHFADSNGGNSGFRLGWNQDDPAIEFSLGNGTARTLLKSTDTGNGNTQFSNATIPIVVEAFWDGSTMSLTVNGKTTTTPFTGLSAGNSQILVGLETAASTPVYTRLFGAVYTKNSVPSATVRADIRTRMGRLVSMANGATSATETGSDTYAQTGAVKVAGALAVTEPNDTIAAPGKVVVTSTAGLVVTESSTPDTFASTGGATVNGALAVTEPSDTFAAPGKVTVTSTTGLVVTEGNDTFASTGNVPRTGTLAATETATADTFASTGSVFIVGALAVSEVGSDIFTPASGTVAVAGTLAATETGADTFASTGTGQSAGGLAVTETGSDTWTPTSGTVKVTGALAVTDPSTPDTFAADADLIVTGTLASTDQPDTFASIGTVQVSSTLAAFETGSDTAGVTGAVMVAGALASTETGNDTSTTTGAVAVTSVTGLVVSESATPDTLASTGGVKVAGALAVTEASTPDTFASTGTVLVSGALAATDAPDTYASTGAVKVAGALAAAETATADAWPATSGTVAINSTSFNASETGSDTFAADADLFVTGSLIVTEAPDTYASTGAVKVAGALAVTEASTPDTYASTGAVKVTGALARTETGNDTFNTTTGLVFVAGPLAATEQADTFSASSSPIALVFATGAAGSWFKGDPGNFSLNGTPFDRSSTYNYAGATTYDRQADRWRDLSPSARDMVAPDYANDPIFAMIGADPGAQANETWGTTAYGKVAGVGGASTGFYYAAGVTPDAYEGTIWSDASGNTGFNIAWEQDTPAFHFSAGTGSARVEVTADTLNTQFQNGTTPVLLECWYDGANLNIRVNGGATVSTPCASVIAGNSDVLIGTSAADTTLRAFVRTFQQVYTKDYVPSQSVRDGVRLELAKSIGIAGPAASTETGTDTIAAPGAVKVAGALAATEANDTFTGSATIVSTGSLVVAETNTPDTWTPTTGTVLVKGPLAVTETGTDTHAASGTVLVSGALAATEPTDTLAAPGQVKIISTAGLVVSETGSDTFQPTTGLVKATGALVVTEGADTAASTGTVLVQGSLAPTEGSDTSQIDGDVLIAGALAVSETGSDTYFGTAGLIAGGTLAATDQPDTISASGAVAVSGALAATEAPDTCASTGTVKVAGALAVTEVATPDTYASTGAVPVSGALASTETGNDTAAATGAVAIVSTSGLIVSESPVADTAASTGTVKVAGALAVSEVGSDTAASTGVVPIQGALARAETGTDTLAASGVLPVAGGFAVTEANDVFSASANPVALVFASGANGFWLEAKPANMLLNGAPIDRMSTYNYAGATDYDRQVDTFKDQSPNGRNMVAQNGEVIFAMIGADPGAQAGEMWGTCASGLISGVGGSTTAFYFAGGVTPDAYDIDMFSDVDTAFTGFNIRSEQDSNEIIFSAGTGSARVEIRGYNGQKANFQNGDTPLILEAWYESGFLNLRCNGVPSTPVACATVAAGTADLRVGDGSYVRTFHAVMTKNYAPSSATRDGVRLQIAKSIGLTGPIDASEAPDTFASTGAVKVTGSLASTETGIDTFAAAGVAKVSATLAVTETGNDTAASTGTVLVQGTLARAETGNDTSASTGTVLVSGSLASTEDSTADTYASTGAAKVTGALAVAEQAGINDTFSATAGVVAGGTVAASETGSDTYASTGAVAVAGALASTEAANDTFSGAGQVPRTGSLAATEASDTYASTGAVAIISTAGLNISETGSDTTSFNGRVLINGTTTGWTEPAGQDVWTPTSGKVVFTGTLASTESGPDTFTPTSGVVKVHGDMAALEGNDVFIASADPLASCFATGANGYWLKATPANLLLSGTPLDRMSTFQGSYPPGTDPTVYDRTADTWKDLSPNQRNMVLPDYANDPLFGLVGDTGNFMQGLMWGTTGYGRIATVGGSTTAFYYAGGVTPDAYDGVLWSDANGNTGFKVQNDQDSNTVIFSAGTGSTRVSCAAPNFQAPAPSNGYRPILVEAWYDGVNINVRCNGGATFSTACPVVSAGNANALIGKEVATDSGKYVRTFQQVMTKNYLPPQSVRDGVRQELAKSISVHIGPMAPSETGLDTAAATGGVQLTAVMSALETVSDTFAATGIKERLGTLAATDQPDTFSGAGVSTVNGTAPINEGFLDTFVSSGAVAIAGTGPVVTESGVDTIAVQGYPHPTGALAASETATADTAAATGTVKVTGTFSSVEGTDAFASSGAVLVQGSAPLAETGADTAALVAQTTVRGVLAVAETGSDTAASTGAVAVRGTLAATEPADTADFPGTVRVFGSLAQTEPGVDTILVGGKVPVAGALASTEGNDTATITGTANVRGSMAVAEVGDDSFTPATGVTLVSGVLAASESGADGFASTGLRELRGALAVSEAGADTAQGAGTVAVAGPLAASEVGNDTASGAGQVPRTGAAAASEVGSDTYSASGGVQVQGTFSASEANDTLSGAGAVVHIGTMAATEEVVDACAIVGVVKVQGGFTAVEAIDTMTATGSVRIFATLAANETRDIATIAGTVLVKGALVAVEHGGDTIAATGSAPRIGQLLAVEVGADGISMTAQLLVRGAAPMAEGSGNFDGMTSTGFVRDATEGVMVAIEDPDAFAADGVVFWYIPIERTYVINAENKTLYVGPEFDTLAVTPKSDTLTVSITD